MPGRVTLRIEPPEQPEADVRAALASFSERCEARPMPGWSAGDREHPVRQVSHFVHSVDPEAMTAEVETPGTDDGLLFFSPLRVMGGDRHHLRLGGRMERGVPLLDSLHWAPTPAAPEP